MGRVAARSQPALKGLVIGPRWVELVRQEMNPDHWEMEFYEDENGNEPCKDFIEDLATPKKLAIQAALINILARQGPDVCETEFGKPLRDGLYEFRLRHSESEILTRVRPDLAAKIAQAGSATEKILLRVFFHPYGDKILLLIGGYDKGENPSKRRESAEIHEARKLLKRWKEQHPEARNEGQGRRQRPPLPHSFRAYWAKIRKRGN